jgi:hypothetical protein
VQRVGAPFGVAVIAVILENLLDGASTPSTELAAYSHTFWWAIGLSAIPLLFAALLPGSRHTDLVPDASPTTHA